MIQIDHTILIQATLASMRIVKALPDVHFNLHSVHVQCCRIASFLQLNRLNQNNNCIKPD